MTYFFFHTEFEGELYVIDYYVEKFNEFETISIFLPDDKLKKITGGFFFNFLRKINPEGPLMFTFHSPQAEKLKSKIADDLYESMKS